MGWPAPLWMRSPRVLCPGDDLTCIVAGHHRSGALAQTLPYLGVLSPRPSAVSFKRQKLYNTRSLKCGMNLSKSEEGAGDPAEPDSLDARNMAQQS